jgi:hypothetical protein
MVSRRSNSMFYGLIAASFLVAIAYWVSKHLIDNRGEDPDSINQVLADLDKYEPGWQLEDFEAKRQPIPDDQNGALCVLAARKLLPEKWPTSDYLNQLPSDMWAEQLNEEQISLIQHELTQRRAALEEAHKLENLPAGRYPHHPSSNAILFKNTPRLDLVGDVANLLTYEAFAEAHLRRFDKAWRCCLAILNVARSLGDEPGSQYFRMHVCQKATYCMMQTLARGEVTEAELHRLQEELIKEANYSSFFRFLREERVYFHKLWSELEDGNTEPLKGWGIKWHNEDLIDADVSHARVIQFLTRLIQIIPLSAADQNEALQELPALKSQIPQFARKLLRDSEKSINFERRKRALLRCALTALAAERFRLKHHNWPDSLNALVPLYLDQVPIDPFDDKPLRYRQLKDQILIYSISDDLEDNGGSLSDNNQIESGRDCGTRLWNPDQRGKVQKPGVK